MSTQNSLFALGACVAAALASPAAAKVKILGNNYSDMEVCRGTQKNCALSNNGNTVTVAHGGPKIFGFLADGSPDYDYVLGKVYQSDMSLAGNYCGNVITNDLKDYANSIGIEFYKVYRDDPLVLKTKVKKVRALEAGVDFVEVAKLAGIPNNEIPGVTAALKAAYSKNSAQTIDIKGRFLFAEINQTLLAQLKAVAVPAAIQGCSTWLKQTAHLKPKYRNGIYDSLTGFVLTDASASTELKEGITAELKAKLNSLLTNAEIVSLSASMATEIEKTIRQSFKPNVTILTLGKTIL